MAVTGAWKYGKRGIKRKNRLIIILIINKFGFGFVASRVYAFVGGIYYVGDFLRQIAAYGYGLLFGVIDYLFVVKADLFHIDYGFGNMIDAVSEIGLVIGIVYFSPYCVKPGVDAPFFIKVKFKSSPSTLFMTSQVSSCKG